MRASKLEFAVRKLEGIMLVNSFAIEISCAAETGTRFFSRLLTARLPIRKYTRVASQKTSKRLTFLGILSFSRIQGWHKRGLTGK